MSPNKHVRFTHDSLNESTHFSPANDWQAPQMHYYELSPASTSSVLSQSPSASSKRLYSPASAPRMVPLTPSPYDNHIPLPQTPYMNAIPIPPSRTQSPDYAKKSHSSSVTTTTLAFLLLPPLDMKSSPGISWDMITYPDNARMSLDGSYLNAKDSRLAEPATYPPLPSLTIFSPNLPWEFTITPSSGSYVRVIDVLQGLSRELRVGLSEKEYLKTPKNIWEKVDEAYKRRYRRDPKYREQEKAKGPKRVDFLFGRTNWMGLSPSNSDERWQLNFA